MKKHIETQNLNTVNESFDRLFKIIGKSEKKSSWLYQSDKYYSLIREESDRGAVIVASIIIEGKLKKMIDAFLVEPSASRDKAFLTKTTLEHKINLCYRLGLISEPFKEQLSSFRNIRNDFVHSENQIEFKLKDYHDFLVNGYKNFKLIPYSADLFDRIFHIINKDINNDFQKNTPANFIKKYGDRPAFNVIFTATCAALELRISVIKRLKYIPDESERR